MLSFIVLFIPLLFFFKTIFAIPIIVILMWFYYLSSSSFSFNTTYFFDFYLFDEYSLFLSYITFFIIFISFLFAVNSYSLKLNLTFFFMLLFCLCVFVTNNLFILYFSYEASLLPILFIIIKWGSYPERSLSAFMLMIYTSLFTFPFIYVLFYIYNLNNTFTFFMFSNFELSSFLSFIIFLTFAVKLPIYGLHFWLPMAHVEAPTFGSMILAGILLKLGGMGLIRLTPFLNVDFLKSTILSYLLVFMIYVTIVCCIQSDFKRLVAYSSVSHMMAIPILIISNNLLSSKTLTMMMFLHGLSSPILFMLVGVLYNIYSSRQLVSMRGLLLVSPSLSFIIILAFFFTLSAPPFPSFLSEAFFVVSSLNLTKYIIIVLLLFCFLSLVYNLNWLSSILFFSSSLVKYSSSSVVYYHYMPLFVSFTICVPFSLLFYFI